MLYQQRFLNENNLLFTIDQCQTQSFQSLEIIQKKKPYTYETSEGLVKIVTQTKRSNQNK